MHARKERSEPQHLELEKMTLPRSSSEQKNFRALNSDLFKTLRQAEETLRSILFSHKAAVGALILAAHEAQGSSEKIKGFFELPTKEFWSTSGQIPFEGHSPSIFRKREAGFDSFCLSTVLLGVDLLNSRRKDCSASDKARRFITKARLSSNTIIKMADKALSGIDAAESAAELAAKLVLNKYGLSDKEKINLRNSLHAVLDARSSIFELNTGLARKAATNFSGSVSQDDAFQASSWALLKAIDGYNNNSQFAFSTYAWYWITHELAALAASSGPGPILLPRDMRQKVRRLAAVDGSLNPDGSRASDEDLAKRIKVPAPKLANIKRAAELKRSVSLDQPVFMGLSESEDPLHTAVADPRAPSPLKEAEKADLSGKVNASLQALTPVMRQVIDLTILKGLSLREAGPAMGITYERVRQIQLAALKMLRENSVLRELADHSSGDSK